MSASQTLCLTRLGRPFFLPRASARRVVLLTGEEILTAAGMALIALDGVPAVLIEPERLASTFSEGGASEATTSEPVDGSPAESSGDAARLAVVVDYPGDVLFAIAADQVRPAGDGDAAQSIDLRKGLMDGE